MDLVGPIEFESFKNKRYVLIASDRYSGYTIVNFLKTKDEVCFYLQKLLVSFENRSGERVLKIISDNGSEFKNEKVSVLLALEHVIIEFSAPYTAEQNGAAERRNRTVVETVRTLLAPLNLTNSLWCEAFNTAVFLRNRVIKTGNTKTPYELFIGRRPKVAHLFPFGTEVQVLVNERYLKKLDPRTEPSYIIGFTGRSNTYRVYLPSKNDVKETCDVIFRKNISTSTNLNNNFTEIKLEEDQIECQKQINKPNKRPIDEYFEDLQRKRGQITFEEDDEEEPLLSNENSENSFENDDQTYTTPDQTFELEPEGRILMAEMSSNSTPESVEEAMRSKKRDFWLKAIKDELDAHSKNNT